MLDSGKEAILETQPNIDLKPPLAAPSLSLMSIIICNGKALPRRRPDPSALRISRICIWPPPLPLTEHCRQPSALHLNLITSLLNKGGKKINKEKVTLKILISARSHLIGFYDSRRDAL